MSDTLTTDQNEPTAAPTTGTVTGTSDQAMSSPAAQKDTDTIPMARYLGLQRIVTEREKQIAQLTEQLAQVSAELEQEKLENNSSKTLKTDLAKSVEELNKKITVLESEKTKSESKAERLELLATKYPHLLKMSKYIPQAETLEDYEKEVEEFAKTINAEASQLSDEHLSGSGIPSSSRTTVTKEQELENMWNQLEALAGQPGKEAEYNKLYSAWLDAQED